MLELCEGKLSRTVPRGAILPLPYNDTEYIDKETGEIKTILVPICVPENMCIDEKQIGEDIYTVMLNNETGEIAFMADTVSSMELCKATSPIREELKTVKVINRDLASWYRKFCDLP